MRRYVPRRLLSPATCQASSHTAHRPVAGEWAWGSEYSFLCPLAATACERHPAVALARHNSSRHASPTPAPLALPPLHLATAPYRPPHGLDVLHSSAPGSAVSPAILLLAVHPIAH